MAANELLIKINGDIKGYRDALKAAAKETEDLQKTLSDIAKVGAIAFAGFSAAILLTSSQFSKFQNGLLGVKTLLDETSFGAKSLEEGFSTMGQQALDTFKNIPISLQGVNKSLFDIVSAGVAADKAINVLGSSSRLAVAGITDVSVATDGITSALNAYGISADKSELIAAKFFTAQKFGKTTIAELSAFFGRAASSAAEYGVSLDELLASTAASTSGGIQTAAAMSGMVAVMADISRGSKSATEEADRLGIQFDSTALRSLGLAGFLDVLTESQGFNKQSIEKLFSSVEAQKIVFSLTGNQAGKFKETLDALSDSQKSLTTFTEAYETQSKSLENQTILLKNSSIALAVSIGSHLEPFVSMLNKSMTGLLNFMSDSPALSKFISKVLLAGTVTTGLIATVGVAGVVFLKLRAALIASTFATKGMAFAVKGLMGATGIGLLIAFLPEIIEVFKWVFEGSLEIVKNVGARIVSLAKGYGNILKGIFTFDFEDIKKGMSQMAEAFSSATKSNIENLKKSTEFSHREKMARLNDLKTVEKATEEHSRKKSKIEDASINRKAERLRDENELLRAGLAGMEKEEIAFLKRRQDIRNKAREAELLKDKEQKDEALTNIKLLNAQLISDERALEKKRDEIKSEQEKKEQERAAKEKSRIDSKLERESKAAERKNELLRKTEEREAEKQKRDEERDAVLSSKTQERIQRLKNEGILIKAHLDGVESSEIGFAKRRQDLADQERDSNKIKNDEERALSLENIQLKNQMLLEEEGAFFLARDELRASQLEIETALEAELSQLSKEQRDQLKRQELEDLRKSLETKEKTRSKAVKEKLLSIRKENALFRKDEIEHGKFIAEFRKLMRDEDIKGYRQTASDLAALQNSSNSELKAIGKAAALVNIAMFTAEGAIKAYSALAGIPVVGPGLGIAAAGALTAYGTERAQQVMKAQTGGFVDGSGFGDKMPFMLEPGELITPRKSFDEVVNAVARSRNLENDPPSESGQENFETPFLVVGFDGEEAADVITLRQNESRALGITEEVF